ncbi:hypothetical protein R3P38DRAFT_829535 [Favolaschia claudopus]|uniref:Uncharacterized protein n=1 Tax=Favolaschia claudopus TaxID=2862362 RepID=A0AAW0BZV2_9AGAR
MSPRWDALPFTPIHLTFAQPWSSRCIVLILEAGAHGLSMTAAQSSHVRFCINTLPTQLTTRSTTRRSHSHEWSQGISYHWIPHSLKAPKPQFDLPSDSGLKKPIPEESCHDDVLRATTQTEQFRAILDRMLAEEAELRVAITEARLRGLPGIDLCSHDKIREQDNLQKLPELQRDLPAIDSEESKGQDSADHQFREPGDNRPQLLQSGPNHN